MAAAGRSRVGGCDVTCIRSIHRRWKTTLFTRKARNPVRYLLHHRLAVLLNTRKTDVFNLELDKQKKKIGKEYLLEIKGTEVDPRTSITPCIP
ncbi:hypothetical protein AVEN_254047-1 [Araneus ventricosus]|uniref:Uncharacterized protein n=1 Tax=Araneus ventricosus TaxID=182803 RepID=A0A4Y2C068_ARAVE|nr:hypothetical protein AVEN_254047-1 [Araneus ventricosus]